MIEHLTVDSANADAMVCHLLGECPEHCAYCARRVAHPNISPVDTVEDVNICYAANGDALTILAATWHAIDGSTYQAARVSAAEYRIVCSEHDRPAPAVDCGTVAVSDLMEVITHGRYLVEEVS